MRAARRLAIALGIYLGIVVAVESLIGFMGERHASRGVQPGEDWLVITTADADGSPNDTVVAGVEIDGRLYVSANHWPRAWYDQAVEHPDVEIERGGERTARRAVPVTGAERTHVAAGYPLPWPIRLLTGFPPRSFLRLDPREEQALP